MSELGNSNKKPLIGFFPRFYGMGETYPLIEIAKYCKQLGGEVVFFSHGGEYEYLAEELGYKIIRINPMVRSTSKYFLQHDEEDLINVIKDEALAYSNSGIKALVQTNVFFGCLLASRVAKIPLISVVSGTWIPPYYQQNCAIYPDSLENIITRLIPSSIKNYVYNWFSQKYKGSITKKINRVAQNVNVDLRFKCKSELLLGDYTLICDDLEFLKLKPTKEIPVENYIGAILPEELYAKKTKPLDADIEQHLQRPGRSILFTMGSSFKVKNFFLKFLHILNQTEYNVIALYTTILKEEELPKLNDNILLKKFIPNIITLNQKVDLAITHGGRGTIYQAAYAGKPVVAIPYHTEQQSNVDNLVRHGMAICLSKTFFKEKDLLNAIHKILNNYDIYLKNAQILANKLTKPQGAKRAAKRILELIV